ncbi:stage II sporulation protein P [Paenibacillus sp. GCM10023252]|uniref:stage II sporulation protein P n=1 Tax=Paenibacillus sp. GCM10023252 TaxID=3252649 RepID=UPI00360B4ECB
MKRTMITLDLARQSRKIRGLLVTGRTFALLTGCSMILFIAVAVAAAAGKPSSSVPVSSMRGFAASVSSGFFADMLEMEMPSFQGSSEQETFSGKQVSSFIIRLLTDINPSDPHSLLAGELPGMGLNDSFLIRRGTGTDTAVGPEDNEPIPDQSSVEPGSGIEDPSSGGLPTPQPSANPVPSSEPEAEPSKPTTGGRKIAFIYHSHNRESFYPEVKSGSKDPNSTTRNITLVGKRLAQKLEEQGIGAMHSNTDYPTSIKDYRWVMSYKYSNKTVKEALASNKDIKFLFDIHRDSQHRKLTTTTIGGKDYAQVYFIIGHKNPNWEQNEKFATQIHKALDKNYAGLSRGIWGKTSATGNGEYNQSLASDSVLIEIGGVDNTLEECYRTADVLAKVIADIYWDAEKVAVPKES